MGDALGGDLGGGGLGGGDLGGDLGGGDLGGDDLGGEEPAGGEDDSALLTAPARKDDGHVSRYKKGRKYERKDGVADGRQGSGRLRRSIRSQVAPENITYRSDDRSRVGHSVGRVGIPDLSALVSMEENKGSIYNKDEVLLLENTTNIRKLITQLEAKEAEKDETQQET